ncbi:hypothetical protein MMC13_001112 [Lambiella insularis]|nr:hypothetical protein [Lambiella insularis]
MTKIPKPTTSRKSIQKTRKPARNTSTQLATRLPLGPIQAACQAKLEDHLKSYVAFVNDTIKQTLEDHVLSVQSKMDKEKAECLRQRLQEPDPSPSSARIRKWAADIPLTAYPEIPPLTSRPLLVEPGEEQTITVKQERAAGMKPEPAVRIKRERRSP